MPSIVPGSTLAEIVTDHPDLARELERRSLDYCCGGHRTLAEACATVGLDPTGTAAELSAAGTAAPEPWADLGPAELVDHLEATHHAYLHDELPRLSALVEKVADVHGARHPELDEIEQAYAALRADLEPHLAKEERVLFPMIRELATADTAPAFHCGSLRNPISVMLREHDQAGELLARLRDLTDGYTAPADACASYLALFAGLEHLEADTHLHVHKENNLLFPLVTDLESRLTGRS
jgi:regulator of cell morphogenesis and NO signaling